MIILVPKSSLLVVATPLLLDQFSGATIAFSFNRLTVSWTGSAVQVRRSSDNALQDIGFVNNKFDIAGFNSFIGAGSGFARTLYDQSGNGNHATQTTNASQAQVIIDTDGQPALQIGTGGYTIAHNPNFKTSIVHAFITMRIGNTDNNPSYGRGNNTTDAQFFSCGASSSFNSGEILSFGTMWNITSVAGGPFPLLNWMININNGSISKYEGGTGAAYRQLYQCYDWNSANSQLWANRKFKVLDQGAQASLNWGANTSPLLFATAGPTAPAGQWMKFREYVWFGTTRADAASIIASQKNSWSVTDLPATISDPLGLGFVWTPFYATNSDGISIFDGYPFGDNGFTNYGMQSGCYAWSQWRASNVTNGVELWRYEVRSGDSDMFISGDERNEAVLGGAGSPNAADRGNAFEVYMDVFIEPGSPDQYQHAWSSLFQHHYNDISNRVPPDLFSIDICTGSPLDGPGVAGGHFWFTRGGMPDGSSPVQYDLGVYSTGVWYGIYVSGFWSANGTSDTCKVYFGTRPGPLQLLVNLPAATLFASTASPNTTPAYPKDGHYRGRGIDEAPFAHRKCNHKCSETAGAFAAYINNPPPLPTHS